MRKRVTGAAIAALLAFSLTGCGSSGGSASSSAGGEKIQVKGSDYLKADYKDLKDGGTLTLPISELSEQENPFHMDGSAYTTQMWYWYNPQMILFDDNYKPYANPAYLTDMKAEEKDGKTVVTYKINPKAHFNDGTPIDWKVFETTWKISNGTDNDSYPASSTDGYQDIESVTKGADDREAVVTFKRVFPWWQGLFNYVANPHLADKNVYQTGYLKKLHPEWGAGPYTVENADFNAGTVSFIPNPKWWGDKPKLEKVTYKFMEVDAQINALKNGEIDGIDTASAGGVNTKEMLDKVKGIKGVKRYTSAAPSIGLLMLNSGSEILKDAKVREAIMTAIDRKQIDQIIFNGLDYKEDPVGSLVILPSMKDDYKDNFGQVVKFDKEKAKKLLDEAGWKEGSDGIREKDGKKLQLNYPFTAGAKTKEARIKAVQKMLKDVGIDAQVKERPGSEFSTIITKKEFDLFDLGFRSSDPFGVAYFGQIYQSDSGLNRSGTGTKEFDKKIEELQNLPTAEEQIKRGNELEVEAMKTFGVMPIFAGPDIAVMKDGLANIGSLAITTVPREHIGWKK